MNIDIFKRFNIKKTKQREAIYAIIANTEKDMSLKDIISQAKDINNSTVYRIIDLFVEKKIIFKRISSKNEIFYEVNSLEDKHYIKCVKCHKKEEIEMCPISDIDLKGFKIINHDIEINGICNDCYSEGKNGKL